MIQQKDIRFEQPGSPLIHPYDADMALRDLMPVVDHLTSANASMVAGTRQSAADALALAFRAFRTIPETSPALAAYVNWLRQNAAMNNEDDNP